ncbi:MAG: DNA mismatch repair endonuclease MutL [Flavobacteriales bacterium]
MSDIIALLPDAVANQIAAGEVVQRPASAVKEMLENAVDAGATDIRLVIKDAGKTLIQVIDNGCGMSRTDASLSFERHATSKIKDADDLFRIHTKGFRGEALASIAAVAQVELKTRLHHQEIGTHIKIAGSEIEVSTDCQTQPGTSLAVKNLYFNVPARRNFLKSDPVETRHIIDEFQRVALTHPDIAFTMHHNGNEVFNLPAAVLRQRVVNVMGNKFNQRLVPAEEYTDILQISGFITKPEFARKSRGEQFLFVNKRFIKSPFLHNAIIRAYGELLAPGTHPAYFIYLEMDPSEIDVNIHPTKTEIKFQDEKTIYALLHSSIRQSLGKFNVTPTLDFEQETSFSTPPLQPGQIVKPPTIRVNPDYNPFRTEQEKPGNLAARFKQPNASDWKELYQIVEDSEIKQAEIRVEEERKPSEGPGVLLMHREYAVTQIASGMVMIHLKRALERIEFEKHRAHLQTGTGTSQRLLFPQTIGVPAAQVAILEERMEDLTAMGFELNSLGGGSFSINGIPSGLESEQPRGLVEELLEQLTHLPTDLDMPAQDRAALAVARSAVRQWRRPWKTAELKHLVDELFACEQPYYSPTGKATIATFTHEEITDKFD